MVPIKSGATLRFTFVNESVSYQYQSERKGLGYLYGLHGFNPNKNGTYG